MFDRGVLSPNEWRRREGDNPIPNGDEHFVPMNMQTLEAAMAAADAPAQPVNDGSSNEPPPSKEDDLSAWLPIASDGILRIYRRRRRIAERAAKTVDTVDDFECLMLSRIASDKHKAAADIKSVVETVGKTACNQAGGWWSNYTVVAFLKTLGDSMQQMFRLAFESGDVSGYLEQREIGMAHDAARMLVKATLVAAKSTNKLEYCDV